MSSIDDNNLPFQLATELVCNSSQNVFLTGKAGTGKTTFLKYIKEHCLKQMAVLAPTGVAAINAGGVTIHSFLQLPFTPFLPESAGLSPNAAVSDKHTLLGRIRFNAERLRMIRELELLIIDEISMVRCDVLDAVDVVLRHTRHNYRDPFGGVQILFIGDLYQLPPVAKEAEWEILSKYYRSPYFFSSKVIESRLPVCIEFQKIYRQSEQDFIDLLNQVRNNSLNERGFQMLKSRFDPNILSGEKQGHIILTTHNNKARNINAAALEKLPEKEFKYPSNVEGEFSEQAFPADAELTLKVGAQVMFLKNDSESRRYFNGCLGIVKKLEDDRITISCRKDDGGEEDIEVGQEKWENIRYSLDHVHNQIKEDVVGSFSQFPLRLAWAITIHKSQGLTFEKAIIDAGSSFSPGQVYVALSRCTSLKGMVLGSEIISGALATDPRIANFAGRIRPVSELSELASAAKKDYQVFVVSQLFELKDVAKDCKKFQYGLLKHSGSFSQESFDWSSRLLQSLEELQATAEKFFPQLRTLFDLEKDPQQNQTLINRLKAAAEYFSNHLEALLQQVRNCPLRTDNRQLAKDVNEYTKELHANLSFKLYMLQGFSGKFDIVKYFLRKKSFVIPAFKVNSFSGSDDANIHHEHAALYIQLKNLRTRICHEKNIPAYMVISSQSLDQMCNYLPQTLEELSQISGFGKVKLESYGQQFLSIIQEYAAEQKLHSRMYLKAEKKKRNTVKEKKDTKGETFSLFKKGKSVEEIAVERQLAISTIQGHLCHYIQSGDIDIAEVVAEDKIKIIEGALRTLMTVLLRLSNSN